MYTLTMNANMAALLVAILATFIVLSLLDYRMHCQRIDALKTYHPGRVTETEETEATP